MKIRKEPPITCPKWQSDGYKQIFGLFCTSNEGVEVTQYDMNGFVRRDLYVCPPRMLFHTWSAPGF